MVLMKAVSRVLMCLMSAVSCPRGARSCAHSVRESICGPPQQCLRIDRSQPWGSLSQVRVYGMRLWTKERRHDL